MSCYFLKKNYERQKKLYDAGVGSGANFQKAEAAYNASKAMVNGLQAQLRILNVNTTSVRNGRIAQRISLRSPIEGFVQKVEVKTGQYVEPQTELFEIVNTHHVHADVMVFEKDVYKVKKGQKVKTNFSVLPGKEFDGKVLEISYAAVSTPTYPAIIRLLNPSKEIRPGMAASVTFNLGDKNEKSFLVSPVPAVGEDADGNFTFVLEKGEGGHFKVKKRRVEIGELLPDGFEIKEGLSEGELVATAGLKSLLEGMKVKLME